MLPSPFSIKSSSLKFKLKRCGSGKANSHHSRIDGITEWRGGHGHSLGAGSSEMTHTPHNPWCAPPRPPLRAGKAGKDLRAHRSGGPGSGNDRPGSCRKLVAKEVPGPAFAISSLYMCCLLRTGGVSETTGFSGQDEFTKKEEQTDHKSVPLRDWQQGISPG